MQRLPRPSIRTRASMSVVISPAVVAASSSWAQAGDEALDEVVVQRLEGVIVGLQGLGQAALGDQKVDEEVAPARQRGVRCRAGRQQRRTSLFTGLRGGSILIFSHVPSP